MKEVQALSLITIAKMVEKGGPEHIRPQLARLVPAMLESLSGMEVCFLSPSFIFSSGSVSAESGASIVKSFITPRSQQGTRCCAGYAAELCGAACGAHWAGQRAAGESARGRLQELAHERHA